MAYEHRTVEPKWQARWRESGLHKTPTDARKPKFYALDMFPYPSGAGLHVGHCEGYTATDVITRWKRMQGFRVLHPMGWDAFGLPAENYAIKHGVHPRVDDRRRDRQLPPADRRGRLRLRLGARDRHHRSRRTCSWTQWIFLKLYERDLAFEAVVPINWCPSCKTGLANEEVSQGRCERCGSVVVRKDMRQWMLRITRYADRLLADLDELDWPASTVAMQRNWIGRSEGAEVVFTTATPVAGRELRVFTTRPDTLYGATYMVLSPEHALVDELTTPEQRAAVAAYQEQARRKSDLERTDLAKEKTGVFTGATATNPVNGKQIPIWIADYVLASYGTGAIMAVPAHDERDFEFAKKFGIPIVQVVAPADGVAARSGPGVHRRRRGRQLGAARRPAHARGEEEDHRRAGGARRRQGRGQLPAARLGVLAPALLGRADPAHPLPERRRRAGARGAAAGAAARRRALRADRHGRVAAGGDRQLRQHDLPEVRRPGEARDQHDAAVGGLVLVLPALPRPEERRARVRSRRREGVDAGRPLRRRRRARRAAPALRALLAQGAVRHRPGHARRSRSRSCATRGRCWRTRTRTRWAATTSSREVELRGDERVPEGDRREAEGRPSRRWPRRR